MTTYLRTVALVGLLGFGISAKPAEAQVSLGIATPGFALGIGPGAGYVGGGYYPAYPAVVAPPIYAPRPVFIPPPVYARPYYGGYAYGRGYGYPHPGGRPGYYGPHRR